MKIKTQLTLGIGLLFSLIILLSIVSIQKINGLSKDTENILKENYNTLDYCRNMLHILNEAQENKENTFGTFSEYLHKQRQNSTEIGEGELNNRLTYFFARWKSDYQDTMAVRQMRSTINQLMKLNMTGIEKKSDLAEKNAKNAIIWIGSFCVLIGLGLFLDLPKRITKPILSLSESIKQIASQNYSQRVYLKRNDEFGDLANTFNSMAEKLEEYSKSNLSKLILEKKRVESLIGTMQDPVFGLDENQIVIFTNKTALQIIGLKEEECIGKTAKELSKKNDLGRLLFEELAIRKEQNIEIPETQKDTTPLKIYANNKEGFFEKITIALENDDEKLPISNKEVHKELNFEEEFEFNFGKNKDTHQTETKEIPLTPTQVMEQIKQRNSTIQLENGEEIIINQTPVKQKKGFLIVLKDITAYKELDAAKTNFIATVSHEFKTPVAAIRMSLQLLENKSIGKLNDDQTNLVKSIDEDAIRLLKITDELLNMTQLESGNIQLNIRPTFTKNIVEYVINTNKIAADQKEIEFVIKQDNEKLQILADAEKSAWVLTNLISNAIRHSYEKSSIIISVLEGKTEVIFAVKDNGQGIAPEYQQKIFDRYFRAPNTNKQGTGLGLAISKEFVEAQNGKLGVESEVGEGSTFYFSLKKLG